MSEDPLIIEGVDVDTFQNFEEDGYSDEEALALSQGLLEGAIPCLKSLYSGLSDYQKMIVKFAVMEMAKYLKLHYEDFSKVTSPFQSESIANYSYSKMAASIKAKENTGVPAFDRAVDVIGELCSAEGGTGEFQVVSETVFQPGYGNFIRRREGRPYNPWSGWV